jgi:hypothetical protein
MFMKALSDEGEMRKPEDKLILRGRQFIAYYRARMKAVIYKACEVVSSDLQN